MQFLYHKHSKYYQFVILFQSKIHQMIILCYEHYDLCELIVILFLHFLVYIILILFLLITMGWFLLYCLGFVTLYYNVIY